LIPFLGTDSDKCFWKPDIIRMAKLLESYTQDIAMQKAGAVQSLENFKEARIKAIQEIKAVRIRLLSL
jgi:hypothetical protein